MSKDDQSFKIPLDSSGINPAADLIRSKISTLYAHEPDAGDEALDLISSRPAKLSVHQQYMLSLTQSDKSVAEIQTQWHEYYQGLSERQKHEVWDEFYDSHAAAGKSLHKPAMVLPEPAGPVVWQRPLKPATPEPLSVGAAKQRIHRSVAGNKRLSRTQHAHSLLFGLGFGGLFMLLLMFGFFNERFIAPFITPSRTVTNTPIIADGSTAAGADPKIIIPKINVEIPVVYDQPSIDEKAVQHSLENGVVHYANTPLPGQDGNLVIVGHSSNNIFNKGKYKFAFVLLSKMEKDDTFTLQKDGKRYVYRVYEKRIVKPSDVGVLGAQTKAATATLITCDPPGTSVNRLVVVGEQVTPDPLANAASTQTAAAAAKPAEIPGNAPSLWSRIWGSVF